MKPIFEIVFFTAFFLSCAAGQTRPQPVETEGYRSSKPEAGLPDSEPIELNGKIVSSINAQDITGEWQGLFKDATGEYRGAFYIAKKPDDGLYAVWYAPDIDSVFSMPADSVTLKESKLKITFGLGGYVFEGKLSSDGTSLQGTFLDEEYSQPVRLNLNRATKETAWLPSYKVQFVTVDNNVHLEVLDWGGSGPSLVFLAGLGNTAHAFGKFAPKFISKYHVYGITRRGFGGSSIPCSGYSSDRLGDDVLAVIDVLNLNRPVLVGHSAGGKELSSIGSRYPEKVAGLIYLDALYKYAYYDQAHGNLHMDRLEVLRKLEQYHLQTVFYPADPQKEQQMISDLTQALRRLQRLLRERTKELKAVPLPKKLADEHRDSPRPSPDKEQAAPSPPSIDQLKQITMGCQKYSDIRAPILAIYAVPRELPLDVPNAPTQKALLNIENKHRANLIKAVKKAIPKARIVEIPNASHSVFVSNETDVFREMNVFLDGLEGWSDRGLAR